MPRMQPSDTYIPPPPKPVTSNSLNPSSQKNPQISALTPPNLSSIPFSSRKPLTNPANSRILPANMGSPPLLQKFIDSQNPQSYNGNFKAKTEIYVGMKNEIERRKLELEQKIALQRDRSVGAIRNDIGKLDQGNRLGSERQQSYEPMGGKAVDQPWDLMKNLELLENLRKTSVKTEGLSKSQIVNDFNSINRKISAPEMSPGTIRNDFNRYQKKIAAENKKTLSNNQEEFDRNMMKFFGIDEVDIEKTLDSQAKEGQNSQPRFAKTNLRTTINDPITGTVSNYRVERPKMRPLGTKPVEVFPGKIYDSPAQMQYELPKNTKKAPKTQLFNPLTHESISVNDILASPEEKGGRIKEVKLTEKIGKESVLENGSMNNPMPIYKGMGYKKSNIFT
jgi:hypothetical protein